jgi:hypothetical protein
VTACAFLLPFLIYGFWSYGCYGNILDGFRRISGVAVVAEQPVLDMDEVAVGTESVGVVRVKNLTGSLLRVIGARVDCSCLETGRFPVEIAPYGSEGIAVALSPRASDMGKRLSHRVPSPSRTATS